MLANYVQICNLHACGNCYMLAVQDDDDQPLSERRLLESPRAVRERPDPSYVAGDAWFAAVCGPACSPAAVGRGKRSVLTRDSQHASASSGLEHYAIHKLTGASEAHIYSTAESI